MTRRNESGSPVYQVLMKSAPSSEATRTATRMSSTV